MTDADVRKRCEDILITQLSAGVVDVTDGEMMIYRAAYADGLEAAANAVCFCCTESGFTPAEYVKERKQFRHRKGSDGEPIWNCDATAIRLLIRQQAARGESPTTNKGE